MKRFMLLCYNVIWMSVHTLSSTQMEKSQPFSVAVRRISGREPASTEELQITRKEENASAR